MDKFFNRHGWRRRMRNSGFRITMPRELVLDILSNAKEHLSAKDIYAKILEIDSRIGLTSIYRSLDILVNMGFVDQVNIGDNTTRYELTNTENLSHIHIVCEDSKNVINYNLSEDEMNLLNKLKNNIENKHNITINRFNLQFFGICQRTNTNKE